MPTRISCACGATLKIPDGFAASKAQCPKCQKLIQINQASQLKTAGEETLGVVEAGKNYWFRPSRQLQIRFTNRRVVVTELARMEWYWYFLCGIPGAILGAMVMAAKASGRSYSTSQMSTKELLEAYPDSEVYSRAEIYSVSPDLDFVFADGSEEYYNLIKHLGKKHLLTKENEISPVIHRFLSAQV